MEPDPSFPGGTDECPADKNREGCSCDQVGERAACWPGLRANRNRGVCRDGTTVCQASGEWGPCVNPTLPFDGFETGPGTCGCMSMALWEIDNVSPCFVTYSAGGVWAVSTYIDGSGGLRCPDLPGNAVAPPVPQAGQDWSTHRFTADCAGSYSLCYVLKGGDSENPSASDCVVAKSCSDSVWYDTPGMVKEMPPLPSWTGADPACAQSFRDQGGYGERQITGLTSECQDVSTVPGEPYILGRQPYCPMRCFANPTGPGCAPCNP